jgi:DNA replication protein DnaC
MSAPIIKPIKTKEFETKQSKYEHCGKLPMRAMICGPSGSGKTILLQNMILDIYRGCFSRVYIFSPSITIDHTWEPVKKYIEEEIKPKEDEQVYFDHYDPEALDNIIKTQHKVVEHMKKQKLTKIFQILIIIDDFADDPQFTRHSTLLHQLYIRGRHQMISTITATQAFRLISPIVRKNITDLFVFRLRNKGDLDAILEELSAVYDTKTLLQLYKMATEVEFGFLYVKLTAKLAKDMFYMNFDRKLVPQ